MNKRIKEFLGKLAHAYDSDHHAPSWQTATLMSPSEYFPAVYKPLKVYYTMIRLYGVTRTYTNE